MIVIKLTFIILRNFKRTLIESTKSAVDNVFFKKINEENVKNLFDIEKDNLFYNIIILQLCRNDAREVCNNE